MRTHYLTLPIITISLILIFSGLINFTYGQNPNQTTKTYENLSWAIKARIVEQDQEQLNALEELRIYCFQHASDSPNPVQDLVDKGFLSEDLTVKNCKEVKLAIDKIQPELQVLRQKLRTPYQVYLVEQAMNNTKFNNCLNQDRSVEDCYDNYIGNRPPP